MTHWLCNLFSQHPTVLQFLLKTLCAWFFALRLDEQRVKVECGLTLEEGSVGEVAATTMTSFRTKR